MIFTVGKKYLYDDILERPENYTDGALYKRKGGIVFQTAVDAYGQINSKKWRGFEVYGVDADWDEDTYDIPGVVGMRALAAARPIITLHDALGQSQEV
jgi:hypothetical protein